MAKLERYMQTKNYNSLATSENKVVKLSEETCEKNTQNLNVHISISVFVTK